MQIQVNSEKCNGCGVCIDICPCDVLRLNGETGLAEGNTKWTAGIAGLAKWIVLHRRLPSISPIW